MFSFVSLSPNSIPDLRDLIEELEKSVKLGIREPTRARHSGHASTRTCIRLKLKGLLQRTLVKSGVKLNFGKKHRWDVFKELNELGGKTGRFIVP